MVFELGLKKIDRKYSVEDGSIIYLSYPISSNAERFSHQIIDINRDNFNRSLYITSNKNESVIESILENSEILGDLPDILDISSSETKHTDVLNEVNDVSKSLVVIDIIDVLEDCNHQEYREFINDLSKSVKKSDHIILLNATPKDNKNRTLTEDIADIVFNITIDESSRSEIKPYINLRKHRYTSYSQFSDKIWPIQFKDEKISIDTSRDLA